MALVMRAITPVNEDREPEHHGEFTKTAGDTVYTDYAAAMDGYAVLNTDNLAGYFLNKVVPIPPACSGIRSRMRWVLRLR